MTSAARNLVSLASLAAFGCTSLTLAALHLWMSGQVSAMQLVIVAAAPAALAVAAFRPAALLLGLLAVPPGVLTHAGVSPLLVVALLAPVLLLHGVHTGTAARVLSTGFLGIVAILAGALLHPAAGLGPAAQLARSGMTASIVSYGMLFTVAYVLRRTRAVRTAAVVRALLVSCAGVAIIYVVQTGARPGHILLTGSDAIPNPGLLDHRTHFGYFMALGFAVAFGRVISGERRSIAGHAVAFFFLAMSLVSFARGAWLVVVCLLAIVPFLRGVRGWTVLIPVPLVLVSSVAVFRDRAFGDVSGGIAGSIASGSFGTNRAQLWGALVEKFLDLPWGRGWGTMWLVTPEQLVGLPGVFVSGSSPFVFAHNDFLFMAIELGFLGIAALAAFWLDLVRHLVRGLRARATDSRREAMVLVGPLAVMLVAELFDNGLAMRGLADRFFVVAGLVFALGSAQRNEAAT